MGFLRTNSMAKSGGLIDRLESVISRDPNVTSEHVIPLHKLIAESGNSSSSDNTNDLGKTTKSTLEISIILTAYSILFIFSLAVNFLVCYIMCRTRRLRTVTNSFITNLAMSDIFITVLNIPFNIMRNIMDRWIFGQFMCQCANFILMASVYVSTFTMAAIAIDRYNVIMYPLRPRVSICMGVWIVMATWIMGIVMSLPFAIFAQVTEVDMLLHTTTRCRLMYPEPSDEYERYITLGTFICQYIVPLVVTALIYSHIVYKLWSRETVGQSIETQQVAHLKSRKRSIKMLIIVVAMFSICWLPLNLYHILTDFHPDTDIFHYNSNVYLAFHWLAVSSVCYNPLIYCWSKETFRAELRKRIMWLLQQRPCGHQKEETDLRFVRRDLAPSIKHEYSCIAANKNNPRSKKSSSYHSASVSRNPRSLKSDKQGEIEASPSGCERNESSYYSSVGSKRNSSGVEPTNDSKAEHSWSGYSQFHQWV